MGSGPITGERSAGQTRTLTNNTNTHGLLIARANDVLKSISAAVCQICPLCICAVLLYCDTMTSEELIIDVPPACINYAVFSAQVYSGYADVNIYSRTKCAVWNDATPVTHFTNNRFMMLLFIIYTFRKKEA